MEERVLKILEEINEDIITYDGENMYDEGVISSIDVIEIISELENEFDIEIDAMYADEEYFAGAFVLFGYFSIFHIFFKSCKIA